MRSILAIAIIFGATFAGANTLLAQKNYHALSKDGLHERFSERSYLSKASTTNEIARTLGERLRAMADING